MGRPGRVARAANCRPGRRPGAGGGDGPGVAAALGAEVAGFAGSVLATASRRTGAAATKALAGALSGVPHRLHRWGDAGPNPYAGFLAWADAVVVTGDSVSMLSEALATAVPVFIADPGGLGPRHLRLHGALIAAGQAKMLAAAPTPFDRPKLDEAARVAAEIRARGGLGVSDRGVTRSGGRDEMTGMMQAILRTAFPLPAGRARPFTGPGRTAPGGFPRCAPWSSPCSWRRPAWPARPRSACWGRSRGRRRCGRSASGPSGCSMNVGGDAGREAPGGAAHPGAAPAVRPREPRPTRCCVWCCYAGHENLACGRSPPRSSCGSI